MIYDHYIIPHLSKIWPYVWKLDNQAVWNQNVNQGSLETFGKDNIFVLVNYLDLKNIIFFEVFNIMIFIIIPLLLIRDK